MTAVPAEAAHTSPASRTSSVSPMSSVSPASRTSSVSEGIVTPEAVLLELPVAGVGSRLLAGLIDAGVLVGGWMVLAIVLVALAGDGRDALVEIVAAGGLFAALLVYPVLLQVLMRGRTVGKAALGLRAVTTEGAPIGVRHAVLRTMGGLVDHLVPPGGIAGVLFVVGTRRSQSVGDLIAGTIVIREPPRHLAPTAWWFAVPPGYEPVADAIDPTALTGAHYATVREFLLRAPSLSPAARAQLGSELAGAICRTVGIRREPWMHPEALLLCAASRYQRRNLIGPTRSARPAGCGRVGSLAR